jgi:hypothetical protein
MFAARFQGRLRTPKATPVVPTDGDDCNPPVPLVIAAMYFDAAVVLRDRHVARPQWDP